MWVSVLVDIHAFSLAFDLFHHRIGALLNRTMIGIASHEGNPVRRFCVRAFKLRSLNSQ